MSFIYEFSPTNDQIFIVGSGKVTTADCIDLINNVMADPRCNPDSTGLIDLREVTYEPDDMAEVFQIATALESFQSLLGNNIAVIARQATLFPSEMFSAHVRQVIHANIKVFLDMEAAKAFCSTPDKHSSAPHAELITA